MNIETLLANLADESGERNDALKLLENIVVDPDPRIIEHLTAIIREPESVEDTDPFAALLTMLPSDDYIPPLIETISAADPDNAYWLADYMYALGSLLSRRDEHWHSDEGFVYLMGKWLISKGNSDISWQAATILGHLQHPDIREYLIQGAVDSNIPHQPRIECIRGLVSNYGVESLSILERLERDPAPEAREEAANSLELLKEALMDR